MTAAPATSPGLRSADRPGLLALADPETVAEARRVLAAKGRTFRAASWLLPRDVRDDAAVVYAFCRRADDLADDPAGGDVSTRRAALEALRGELRSPASPLMAAFDDVMARRRIPVAAADHLVQGVAFDLAPQVALRDDAQLLRYAYAVAGTVGLMMARLFDADRDAALPHAVDLGLAMQLTNICRDVAEDAARGRVYLPERRLRAVGVGAADVLGAFVSASGDGTDAARIRGRVFGVVTELLALADRYYQSAWQGLAALPLRPRRAAYAAGLMYQAIGQRVLQRGPDGLLGRAVVPSWRKVGLVWRAYRGAERLAFAPHDAALHASLLGLPGTSAPILTAPVGALTA